jgi:hypothetical protein
MKTNHSNKLGLAKETLRSLRLKTSLRAGDSGGSNTGTQLCGTHVSCDRRLGLCGAGGGNIN